MARGIRPVSLFDDEEKVNNINMSNVLLGGSGITLGATIPNLIMQRNQDMKLIKEYMKQNLASRGSPLLSKAQWANTYGSKLPTKLFEEASGQKGGILKWLGGRTSDAHFAPVEKGIINPAKNIARFTKGIIPTIMNVGSKLPKFPNPVMTVLQGLAPKALGDGMIDEPNFTPFTVQPTVQPTTTPTWTPPPTPTQRNVTKFSPTRSTVIKGGRGGRGNVGGNRMKGGTSKNYGVTGRRVTGGR